MSGGHFDYKDYKLYDILTTLEDDEFAINNNEFEVDNKDEVLKYISLMKEDISKLVKVLHAYDYYIEADSNEISFLSKAKQIYN